MESWLAYCPAALVIAVLLAGVVLAIVSLVRDKRKGRHACGGSCGGNCGCCPMAGACKGGKCGSGKP